MDAERLRRAIVFYAMIAMATISLVVAVVAIAPLAMRLRDDALITLKTDLGLKVMAAAEVATRARNLAQQVTSRTVIRERLEAYNRGETTLPDLADFTRDKLADALNLSPELHGIVRYATDGQVVVAVGRQFAHPVAPPVQRDITMSMSTLDGQPMLVVTAPIVGRGNIMAGTDLVLVDGTSLSTIVDAFRAIGSSSEAALVDTSTAAPRVLIASAPRLGAASGITGQGREGTLAIRAADRNAALLEDDDGYVLAAQPLPASRWVLLLRLRAAEATAAVDRLLLWVMLGASALIAIGVFGLRKVLRPLTGVLIVQHTDMARQIAELEQAKAELAAKTRSLALSNAELQEYAYAASHDLQEPVRTIMGFTQLLKRRYYERMGPEADEFIDFIVEGAERMRRQIQDLLAYARLGRSDTPVHSVDMDAVLAEALEALHGAIAESGARIDAGPLPKVRGTRDGMVRLMQNLIGNAIKFAMPGQAPHVEIVAMPAHRGWTKVVVRDHGIGIEPDYHERIFHMFERLHPRDQVEGSGIGLAICRKVVELQGGRLWVESRPGEGAAFHFLLPLAFEQTVLAKASGPAEP